jgi:hypothetical protein
MSRAPRRRAVDVQVGDLIRTDYHPRTWLMVTAVKVRRVELQWEKGVCLDTAKTRTWHASDDMVPCKAGLL